MKSLSEIETVSKRASRAAGYSWGISEEVGKNTRLLEMFGLPGIKNLNDYFNKRKEQKFENLKLINAENKSTKLQYCPIISGTSLIDQIKFLDNINEIKFEGIAYPLLFLSFLSRSSEILGKRIQLKFDDKIFLLNFNVNILFKMSIDDFPIKANHVEISFIENIETHFKNRLLITLSGNKEKFMTSSATTSDFRKWLEQ